MFYTAPSAVEMVSSPQLKKTMDLVRKFCFSHGLLGEKTKSADDVAVQFPDGAVLGKPERIRFRFSSDYMQLAAQGKL
jgi:NitT/TauT family transport system substrate-binding protein